MNFSYFKSVFQMSVHLTYNQTISYQKFGLVVVENDVKGFQQGWPNSLLGLDSKIFQNSPLLEYARRTPPPLGLAKREREREFDFTQIVFHNALSIT